MKHFALVFAMVIGALSVPCPFLSKKSAASKQVPVSRRVQEALGYDVAEVKSRISDILPNADADFGNYGGFMIRLAWHCAGTYRTSDGRGGCDGGRIRFDPELSWADNAGLSDALELLEPIKADFDSLSWGDLIVLAGNTAIEDMGGPTINFCGGRVDDSDGSDSIAIDEDTQLIYVDAGNTNGSDIRNVFGNMDFTNDTETIALIAGGHTFGKCHQDRSGFEGAWTSTPTQWSGSYIENLLAINWTLSDNPSGGAKQFNNTGNTLMMLVADIALKEDADYLAALNTYRDDSDLLKKDFGSAWEKLVNRDLGDKPCAGEWPAAPVLTIDYDVVKDDLAAILESDSRSTDFNHYGPLFVRFAWHCAGTFRSTDYRGGCDGARILHDPEKSWESNPGLVEFLDIESHPSDDVLAVDLLQPIKDTHGDDLSWADLIILAGTTALEQMGGNSVGMCLGRTDDDDGSGSDYLDENIYLDAEFATAAEIKESMKIMGFSNREMTVLNGGGHAIGKAHWHKSGFEGAWTQNPTTLSNSFFTTLLYNDWVETTVNETGKRQFTDEAGNGLMMLSTDVAFKTDSEFSTFVQEYADDNELFLTDFAAAWEKLINADRFGNACNGYDLTTISTTISAGNNETSKAANLRGTCLLIVLCFLVQATGVWS
mmetsp:Transcript_38057/g.101429  ORF Transcript_38057/g.101429 Transcript_38057/m.101429 type:complete len:657 (-) Transcript_38057:25-1995(-)